MSCRSFNIRVYGILINGNGEVLLSDEYIAGRPYTKFPGGGLEHGEGIKDCLVREFKEELGIHISRYAHLYTTDFFQPSAFDSADQVISIYYRVWYENWPEISVVENQFDFQNSHQVFRWISIQELSKDGLNFPIDKHIVDEIKSL